MLGPARWEALLAEYAESFEGQERDAKAFHQKLGKWSSQRSWPPSETE